MSYKLKLIKFIDNNQKVYRIKDFVECDVEYYGKIFRKHHYKVKHNSLAPTGSIITTLNQIEFDDYNIWKEFKIKEEKMDTVQEIIE